MFSAATEREEFREGASVGVVVTAARRTAAAAGRRRRRRRRHHVHVVCRRAPRNLALSQSQRRVDVSTGVSAVVRRGRNSRWPRADRVEELQQEPEDRVARVRCSRASSPMVRVSATTVETRNSSI